MTLGDAVEDILLVGRRLFQSAFLFLDLAQIKDGGDVAVLAPGVVPWQLALSQQHRQRGAIAPEELTFHGFDLAYIQLQRGHKGAAFFRGHVEDLAAPVE